MIVVVFGVEGELLHITNVRFVGAPDAEQERGLVGWISCTVNGYLRLDGMALRRTVDGRLALSFPARRDGTGRQHFFIRPIDDRARREIEHQVFRALGVEEGT